MVVTPAMAAMPAAAPAAAVAVKVTVRVPAVATTVCVPAAVPSVQEPTSAVPLAFVVVVVRPSVPPPVMAKVTVAPATGFPLASVARTEGMAVTGAPTTAVIVVDVLAAKVVAA